MSQEELFPNELKQAHQTIRDIFNRRGRGSICDTWEEARTVLPPRVLESAMRRGGHALCREALKQTDERGLPMAKPTGSEEGEWAQLALFTHAELSNLIVRESRALIADWQKLRQLRDYCVERFGSAPHIPELDDEVGSATGS